MVVIASAMLYAYFANTYAALPGAAYWANALLSSLSIWGTGWFIVQKSNYGMPSYIQIFFFPAINLGLELLLMNYILTPIPQEQYHHSINFRIFVLFLYAMVAILYKRYRNSNQQIEEKEEQEEQRILEEAPQDVPPKEATPILDRITVRSGNGIIIIPCSDLLYLKANGDYVNLITNEGIWLKEQTLKSFQMALPSDQFVRIHRSFIVNISAISRIERYGQQHLILLKNGENIQISAAGYKTLRTTLNL